MAARGIDVDALNRVKLDADAPGTVSVDEVMVPPAALPFKKGKVGPPPRPATADNGSADPLAKTTVRKPDVRSTAVAEEGAAGRAALPFRKATAEPPRPAKAEDASADPLGKTAEGIMLSPLRDQALPFGPQARVDPEEATDLHAAPGADESSPGEEPPPSLGLSAPVSTPQPLPPLPPHLAAMTVEQYAALCAECAVHPEWVASIHARYRIESDEQRTALDLNWRERFRVDEELTQAWRWHYVRYQEWVKQQQG